jgi:uncharacterized protein YigE (DUF2233 family)
MCSIVARPRKSRHHPPSEVDDRPRRSSGVSRALRARVGLLIGIALACFLSSASRADWQRHQDLAHRLVDSDLTYVRRAVRHADSDQVVSVHLAEFSSRAFRLEVIDLGDGPTPRFDRFEEAFVAVGCLAGINGGFFHPDWRPAGLVIAQGMRINRLETAKLLSGVVFSDARGIHVMRRSAFEDQPDITALLQAGPYRIERSQVVPGLSEHRPSRRSFVATDWRGHWMLGATRDPLSLAALARLLDSPGALTGWEVERAINLDGGSSTGFFFAADDGSMPIVMAPIKRVRNLLGIVPR